jgi:hypothetical protein
VADNAKRIEELKKELAGNPGSRQFYQLGELLRRDGRNAEAAGVLGDGLTHHPRYVAAWVSLGRACLDAAEPSQATHALRRAIELDAQNPVAWRLLGEASLAGGDRAGALAAMEKSLALAPGDDVLKAAVDALASETWIWPARPDAMRAPVPPPAAPLAVAAVLPASAPVPPAPVVEEGRLHGAPEIAAPTAEPTGNAPEVSAPAEAEASASEEAPAVVEPSLPPATPEEAQGAAGLPGAAAELVAASEVVVEPPPSEPPRTTEVPVAAAPEPEPAPEAEVAPEPEPAPVPAAESLVAAMEPPPREESQPEATAQAPAALPSAEELAKLVAISAEDLTSLFTGDSVPETRAAVESPRADDVGAPAAAAPMPGLVPDGEPGDEAVKPYADRGGAPSLVLPTAEDLFTAPSGEDAPAMLAAVLSANEAASERQVGPPAAQPPASLTLARLYLHQNALDEAKRVLELLLEREPTNLEAHDMLMAVQGAHAPETDVAPPSAQARKIAALRRWLDGIARAQERSAP